MTKYGLPICHHINLGQQLLAIHNQLVRTSVELGNAYPKSARHNAYVDQALTAVDKLRAELDSVSADENPGNDEWAPDVYYGNNAQMWEQNISIIMERHQVANPDCICNQPGASW